MKCRTQVGLAIGAGYLLGRRHKTRLALAVGAAALTGGLGGAAGRITNRVTGGAASSDLLQRLAPEVGQLTDAVRGELFELARSAARGAVNSQVDALTGKLHERAGSLRDRITERADVATAPSGNPGDRLAGTGGETGSAAQPRAQRTASGSRRRAGDEATAPRAARPRSGSRASASPPASGAPRRRPAGTAARRARTADDESSPPARRRSSTRTGRASRGTSSARRNGK